MPLRDPIFFAQATVDSVVVTVVWPNEADFSPEFLYDGDDRNPYGDWASSSLGDDAGPVFGRSTARQEEGPLEEDRVRNPRLLARGDQ